MENETIYDDLLDGQDTIDSTVVDDKKEIISSVFDDIDVSVDNEDKNIEPIEPIEPTEDKSAIELFLISKGVTDGKTLTYEDEDGSEIEVEFSSLNSDEQFEIIKELSDPGFSESELSAIQYLRTNNMDMKSLIESHRAEAVQQYINDNQIQEQKVYAVDDYTNEEIYLAHLKSSFPDMSDEELQSELELASSNETSFEKKVGIIKESLIAQEEQYIKEQEDAKVQQYENFKNSLIESSNNFNEIKLDIENPNSDTLEIEESDKSEVLSYILDVDQTGSSKFFKDLSNPDVLMQLAWFRLYGADFMSSVSNYWKEVMKADRRTTKQPVKSNQKQEVTTSTPNKKQEDNFRPLVSNISVPHADINIDYETF